MWLSEKRAASGGDPQVGPLKVLPQATPLRPRLEIGAVDDPAEREADELAERVLRMSEPAKSAFVGSHDNYAISSFDSDLVMDMYIPNLSILEKSSTGKQISNESLRYFEPRFGTDLSKIVVHSDSIAKSLTNNINSRAYTSSNQIFLSDDAQDHPGNHVLAHEISHVVLGQTNNIIRRYCDPTTTTCIHGEELEEYLSYDSDIQYQNYENSNWSDLNQSGNDAGTDLGIDPTPVGESASRPHSRVFSNDNLLETAYSEIDGENSYTLSNNMNTILKTDNYVDLYDALVSASDIRGVDTQDLVDQYDIYVGATVRRDEAEERNHSSVIDLDEIRHPNFMGSTSQLKSGSYVGQYLGIDPIFGALLNPTGGLVGSGNDSYQAEPNSADASHGEAHDAAGFLKTFYNLGPGYNYIDEGLSTSRDEATEQNPLSGHSAGLSFFENNTKEEYTKAKTLIKSIFPIVVGDSVAGELLRGLFPGLHSMRDSAVDEYMTKWIYKHQSNVTSSSLEEKIRVIDNFLSGWISDDDINTIGMLLNSTSGKEKNILSNRYLPQAVRITDLGQRARFRLIFSF